MRPAAPPVRHVGPPRPAYQPEAHAFRPPSPGPQRAPAIQAKAAHAARPRAPAGTIQPMISNQDAVLKFNDLELYAHGYADDIPLPRMSGELVEFVGAQTPPTSALWERNTSHSVVKIYDAASGRKTASGKLRSNADSFVDDILGYGGFDSSNMGNQAQHVLPFEVALSRNFKLGPKKTGPLTTLFTPNTEHPYNAQFLPEKAEFMEEIESIGKVTVKKGVGTLPSGLDISSMSGSFHQGYHSAYNNGMAQVVQDILDSLAATNGGKVTAEMVEAAIFAAQRGGRTYASSLLPLYRDFKRKNISVFLFDHYTPEQRNEITRVKNNSDLADFIEANVRTYGEQK